MLYNYSWLEEGIGNSMFGKMNLKGKLVSAFAMMGVIVLVVGLVGWSGNNRLSEHINSLANNSLPSVMGLWKINEGQTQVQSSERALLNPILNLEKRRVELGRIAEAWQQINEGFKQYESAPQTEPEKVMYKNFIRHWKEWEKDHEDFMEVYKKFAEINIFDPAAKLTELASRGKQNSPDLAAAKSADALLDRLSDLAANEERASFDAATESIMGIIQYNQEFGTAAKSAAEKDVIQTTFWVVLGMIIGPVTAIILGAFLSKAIAQPLDKAIGSIINAIVSSAAEIASTVEQQERIAAEQASSVRETTSTMEELSASSQATVQQSEEAVAGARQALSLTEGGTKAVRLTMRGMSELQQKVGAIASSSGRLSEQASQIGNFSATVSELASKTHMLALNAAVEAVRAGEYGKGFAVVAAEIRKLADESQKSAEKIKALVAEIQTAIDLTVAATQEGTKTVQQGVKIAQKTAEAFRGVAAANNQVVVNNQQIALSAQQQAVAIDQVVSAMNVLNVGAQQTASGITQTRVGTEKLNEAALHLKRLGIG